MDLTSRQRSHLRALAHPLHAVVIVGQAGLTPPVLEEIGHALGHHELIKIKLNVADRDARRAMTQEICAATGATWVQNIGRVAIVYRPAAKPAIELPKA